MPHRDARVAAGRRAGRTRPRALRAVAAMLGLAAIGSYLAIALARLGYPFTLEVLESNSLVEVHRILAGQPLYAAPAVELRAGWLSAALLRRLARRRPACSASPTSRCGWCRWCPRWPASRSWPGWSSGRPQAPPRAWRRPGCWPRPTSPPAPGSTSPGSTRCSWRSASPACTRRGGCAAPGERSRPACCSAAAFLTKQTALAEGAAVLAARRVGPRRRLAIPAALAYAAVLGASTLALGLASHGWYLYYVFEQMSEHALNAAAAGQFWTGYLLPTLGIAARRGAARRAAHASWCCSLAARHWWWRVTPRWCTPEAVSMTCCPPTSSWRCWPGWRWEAASGSLPGGRAGGWPPPRPASWSSPSWRCWQRASTRAMRSRRARTAPRDCA